MSLGFWLGSYIILSIVISSRTKYAITDSALTAPFNFLINPIFWQSVPYLVTLVTNISQPEVLVIKKEVGEGDNLRAE